MKYVLHEGVTIAIDTLNSTESISNNAKFEGVRHQWSRNYPFRRNPISYLHRWAHRANGQDDRGKKVVEIGACEKLLG